MSAHELDPPRILYLMRHGETEFNRNGRYQGHCDSPLTELGVAQARGLSQRFAAHLGCEPVRIVASPLGRARATARILADALGHSRDPETDLRLREVSMGAWDGLTRAEIAQRWPDARQGRGPREWMFHGPGGETLEAFSDRLAAALDAYWRTPGAPAIFVSHAGTGRILRALHGGLPFSEALKLEAPQDAAFALTPGGGIAEVLGPGAPVGPLPRHRN